MIDVLTTIMPVFLILGMGWLSGHFGYLRLETGDALNAYALRFGVPVLLFLAMYRLDFGKAFDWRMLISFYVGAFTCFIIGIFFSRVVFKRRPGEAVAVGFCAVFSNTVLLGVAISKLAFPDAIMPPVFGIIAFHASLLYTVGMTTMEFARQGGRPLGETLKAAMRSVVANPLMIGILSGITFNIFSVPLAGPLEQSLNMIGATAIPVSLIGIGIALNRYKIGPQLSEAFMVSALALALHPAIAFALTYYVFDLPTLFVQAAVVLAAMPPGMNVYIFANMYDRAVDLSATVLIIANILSVFTITAWLLLLNAI